MHLETPVQEDRAGVFPLGGGWSPWPGLIPVAEWPKGWKKILVVGEWVWVQQILVKILYLAFMWSDSSSGKKAEKTPPD